MSKSIQWLLAALGLAVVALAALGVNLLQFLGVKTASYIFEHGARFMDDAGVGHWFLFAIFVVLGLIVATLGGVLTANVPWLYERFGGTSHRFATEPILDADYKQTADVWLQDAVTYLIKGRWPSPTDTDLTTPAVQEVAAHVAGEFRQLAHDGDLQVWGRPKGNEVLTKIDADFWSGSHLADLWLTGTPPEHMRTEPDNTAESDVPIYYGLKANRSQIERQRSLGLDRLDKAVARELRAAVAVLRDSVSMPGPAAVPAAMAACRKMREAVASVSGHKAHEHLIMPILHHGTIAAAQMQSGSAHGHSEMNFDDWRMNSEACRLLADRFLAATANAIDAS